MRRRRPPAVVAAIAALLLTAPTAAQAHDTDRHTRDRDRDLPVSLTLDPAGLADPLIFPEGIAVRGRTVYVGSTTDGTVYRGRVDDGVLTPFLLPHNAEGRTFAVGMKVDGRTLVVAGGTTGQVFAYDTRTGELTGQWTVADPDDPENPSFLNDVAIDRSGDVYVTDSRRPSLYRIDARDRRTDGVEALEEFVGFTGTALQYSPGFNVNGIVVSEDDRYLVLAHSGAGALYRVGIRDRSVVRVDLGGASVSGDGLVLAGRTLWAVERQGEVGHVVTVELDRRLASGTVTGRTTDPSFDDPTTAARVGRSLLVVNSQFAERATGEQPGPFTVSRVPTP